MKLSIILSLTLLGLSSAACAPKHNHAHAKTPSKTTTQPAAPKPVAAQPAAAVSKARGGRGGRGGNGRGGRGRPPPAAAPPAAAPPAAAPAPPPAAAAPPPAANNGNTGKSTNNGGGGGTIPADLVPQFGIQAGVNNQNGNCDGLNNIKIPCACPPDRNAFIAKMQEFVNAGNAEGTPITFPTDDSLNSQITRFTASIVTLQNFNGRPGSGCPASSTTFVGQRAALLAKLA